MDAHVLVDYDNLTSSIQTAGLHSFGHRIARAADSAIAGIDDIFVRLYGGWYGNNGLSRKGSQLAQDIGRNFPLTVARQGKIVRRIHCELASSLVDARGDLLSFTYRQRSGLRYRLTAVMPSACVRPTTCTVSSVQRWSLKGCPEVGCPVTAHEAFSYYEQKLVDSLLCCDLIALAARVPPVAIFLISDDDDLVPALLLAAGSSTMLHVLQIRSTTSAGAYEPMLRLKNIQFLNL